MKQILRTPTIIQIPVTDTENTTATVYGEWEYMRERRGKTGRRWYSRKNVITGNVQEIGSIQALKKLWYHEVYPTLDTASQNDRHLSVAYWRPWVHTIDVWCRRLPTQPK